MWKHGCLLVSALDFRSGGRCFQPSLCRRVVSLDKRLYFIHIVSLFPGVFIGTGDHNAGGNLAMG